MNQLQLNHGRTLLISNQYPITSLPWDAITFPQFFKGHPESLSPAVEIRASLAFCSLKRGHIFSKTHIQKATSKRRTDLHPVWIVSGHFQHWEAFPACTIPVHAQNVADNSKENTERSCSWEVQCWMWFLNVSIIALILAQRKLRRHTDGFGSCLPSKCSPRWLTKD